MALERGDGTPIPAWWIRVTPHNLLDFAVDDHNDHNDHEDDGFSRRKAEDQLALNFARLAAEDARQGMMVDMDGMPLVSMSSLTSKRSHTEDNNGETKIGGGENDETTYYGSEHMFGGRNFQPGTPAWDSHHQWGIDPAETNVDDYALHVAGDWLPPRFIAAMNQYARVRGQAKRPQQPHRRGSCDNGSGGYGYEYLGQQPKYLPAWAKVKLRTTPRGEAIRSGIYDDEYLPAWAKVKLRTTPRGKAIRSGIYDDKGFNPHWRDQYVLMPSSESFVPKPQAQSDGGECSRCLSGAVATEPVGDSDPVPISTESELQDTEENEKKEPQLQEETASPLLPNADNYNSHEYSTTSRLLVRATAPFPLKEASSEAPPSTSTMHAEQEYHHHGNPQEQNRLPILCAGPWLICRGRSRSLPSPTTQRDKKKQKQTTTSQ